MKTLVEVQVLLHTYLYPALDDVEQLTSHSGHLIPGEIASGTCWVQEWVGTKLP
jgi:hypothetical protein